MEVDNDGAGAQAGEDAREPQGGQAAQEAVGGAGADASANSDAKGDRDDGAGADWRALLAERDRRIAELEGDIAEAARTAQAAEALRAEMDELRRQGDEQRIGFELQMAGCRSVKAARALLDDHGGDVGKLKKAEPWLFGTAAPALAGATGLPNAGAASDEGKTMKRWREIAGIADEE